MVRSMTGFGRGEASGESIAVTVEVRSVNHRHLDVALRLPRARDELVARRTAEGDRLAEALRTLHGELTTNVELVSVRAPATTARREDRLRDRLRALLAETAIDQSRIVTEAAVWADKSDVTEELARVP